MKFDYKNIKFELEVCFTTYVDSTELSEILEDYNEADFLCIEGFKVETPGLLERLVYGTNKVFYGHFKDCDHIPRSDDKLIKLISQQIKCRRICFEKDVFNDMLTHSTEIDFFLIGLDINDRRVDIVPIARQK